MDDDDDVHMYRSEREYALKRAKEIKQAVNEHLWDEELGIYIALNVSRAAIQTNQTRVLRRTSVMGFPLFAGIPSKEQAAKLVDNLLKDDMLSKFGIRSTSSSVVLYNNRNEIKPYSNWQVPVWINANSVVNLGMLRYGYSSQATDIASQVVNIWLKICRIVGPGMKAIAVRREQGRRKGLPSWDTLRVLAHGDGARGRPFFLLHDAASQGRAETGSPDSLAQAKGEP